MCCDDCPCAFHPGCLGYEQIPRGKWKCVFCKVAKHGLGGKDVFSKVGDSEREWTKELEEVVKQDSWQRKVEKMVAGVKKWYCAQICIGPFLDQLSSDLQSGEISDSKIFQN